MIKITPPRWFIYVFYGIMLTIIVIFFILNNKNSDKVDSYDDSKDIIDSVSGDNQSGITDIIKSGIGLGDIDNVVQPIDYVYNAIENNTGIFVLSYPEQGNIALTKDGINNYLDNNLKSVIEPLDTKGGYIYIKLRDELKVMYLDNQEVLQPIQIKTNISQLHQIGYRLDTSKSLAVYEKNKEFLYELDNFPIRGAKDSNILKYLTKGLKISGLVSDPKGNGIDKIIFIRQR